MVVTAPTGWRSGQGVPAGVGSGDGGEVTTTVAVGVAGRVVSGVVTPGDTGPVHPAVRIIPGNKKKGGWCQSSSIPVILLGPLYSLVDDVSPNAAWQISPYILSA